MKKSLLLLSLFIVSINCFAQTLFWITPTNGHQFINDISFISSDEGIAVCDNGVILKFSGGKWIKMQSPVTYNLTAVDMINSNDALACGSNGCILKYNSNNWTILPTPDNRQLRDITYIDTNHAYAVGDGILQYDGSQWIDQNVDSMFMCADFMSANEGWAAGFGINNNVPIPYSFPLLYHFSNGLWIPDNSLENYEIIPDHIQVFSPDLIRLTGHNLEGDGFTFDFNGDLWVEHPNGPNTTSSFTSADSGFGVSNTIGISLDQYPVIYKYNNNLWSADYTGLFDEYFTSVQGLPNNEAYVSTAGGFVYHGLNDEWNISNGFTADNILDISFTEDNNGYFACGSEGIWHYYAGIWSHELKVPGFTFNVIESLNYEVWASGYRETDIPGFYDVVIYRKANDLWSLWTSPYELTSPVTSLNYLTTYTSGNQINYSGPVSEQSLLLPADSITSFGEVTIIVDNEDLSMGYVTTKRSDSNIKGAIYSKIFTDDWVPAYETSTAQFNDVKAFRYGTEAYAVGNNGLMAYTAGIDWTEIPPLTTDDLLSLGFDTQNTGWAVGRNGTILYFDGNDWSLVPPVTDKDLYTVLNHTYPFDVNISVIGGTDGTLLADIPSLPTHRNEMQLIFNEPLTIFPNPSSGSVTLTLSNKHSGDIYYDVYDLSGKRLFFGELNDIDNDLKVRVSTIKLSQGTYILKVRSEGLIQSGKMVII